MEHHVTQFTLVAGIWVMLATARPRTVWQLAGLAAATYLVRPGDAVSFAPMLVWAVVRLPAWRERLTCGAGGLAIIAATAASVGWLNREVFGTWRSPYEEISSSVIGFLSFPPTAKFYWIFIDGRPFFGETDTALFFRYPWLFLAIPGAIHWVRRDGMSATAALAALVLNWLLYVNYNDFMPSGLFRYAQIHYLAWGFAPLFLLAATAVRHGWRERAGRIGLALATVAMIFSLGLRMREREQAAAVRPGRVDPLPAERPLWIRFPGVAPAQVTQLRLDGRSLRDLADYQAPDAPSDLRLLLSAHTPGTTLAAVPEAGIAVQPIVGDFAWSWEFDLRRLRP